ncbi:MAG: dodecin family protein [Weeksellaceae bacterium]|jgi:flavin-binding protein dodecin|nr:dodecin family protein [Weeksellaceae bacterium]
MSVLKVLEIMASSENSWEEATQNAIAKVSQTVKGIKSAWVKDQSVIVKDGKVAEYRVSLKVSFQVE